MTQRLSTLGYLLSHWGLGIVLGSLAVREQYENVTSLGLVMLILGNILVAMFRVKK